MSELCMTNTTKKKKKSRQFSSLLLSDLFMFCSFILSHPLYFSYFIFFSPYLLKLLSFLSPLFITTSLLLLSLLLLTISPKFSESEVGLILSTYNAVTENLQSKTEDENQEFHQFEELEVYRIVFDTSILDLIDKPVQDSQFNYGENCLQAFEEHISKCLIEDKAPVMEEQSTLEGFLKEFDEFENVICIVEEEKKVESLDAKPDKVEEHREESLARIGSEAKGNLVIFDEVKDIVDKGNLVICDEVKVAVDNGEEYTSKVTTKSSKVGAASVKSTDNGGEYTSDNVKLGVKSTDNGGEYASDNVMDSSRTLGSNLGSYGSMRREKEWKRTLACKLFEERHNVEGGEGMDSLWETYESDSTKIKQQKGKNTKKKIIKKKSEIGYFEDDDEDLEEDEYMDGQLCCLQALKFSSGKMNLGMGKPNLVKISKAIKGIGWLHHLTRHGKKGHN